ncbi:unnamed protein product [Ectocarpus sp. 6 AP-2014]
MLPGGGVVSISKPSVLIGSETCMLPEGGVVSIAKLSFRGILVECELLLLLWLLMLLRNGDVGLEG